MTTVGSFSLSGFEVLERRLVLRASKPVPLYLALDITCPGNTQDSHHDRKNNIDKPLIGHSTSLRAACSPADVVRIQPRTKPRDLQFGVREAATDPGKSPKSVQTRQ